MRQKKKKLCQGGRFVFSYLDHDQKDSGINRTPVGRVLSQLITLLLLTLCEDLFSDSLPLILEEVEDLLINGSLYPSCLFVCFMRPQENVV